MVKKKLEKFNELSGSEWLKYSFSIWRDIRKNKEETKINHPAMFPTSLTSRLIDIFTKKNDTVLDPFMGSGSTIISAYLKGRKGIGFELSKNFVDLAKRRLKSYIGLFDKALIEPEIYLGDVRNLIEKIKPNTIKLCITSPPYWDILNRPHTADRKSIISYSKSKEDLGNIKDYEEFLTELKGVFSKVFNVLIPGGYCVVVVMDIRKKDKFYPFHSDLSKKMQEIGFLFEDIIIWDRQYEYNYMKPLGYPYAFRVNKVHEYILIFKKPKND